MSFDAVLMIDWSGGNDRGPAPKKDAIWTCIATSTSTQDPIYHRNRQVAETYITDTLDAYRADGKRLLVGIDLCFAYPKGFAKKLTGADDPFLLWDWFEARVEDASNTNNRFDLAGEINARFPGTGPYWFNGLQRDIPDLPRKGTERTDYGLPEFRETDRVAKGAFSPWQLAGAGAVGGQVIMGFPMLSRLRQRFRSELTVWPFEPAEGQIVLAETYFSLLPDAVKSMQAHHSVKDAAQVAFYAEAFARLTNDDLTALFDRPADPEGWVLGLGHEDRLIAAPPLSNDCFTLPRGADWTPVDDVLDHLKTTLIPIASIEKSAVSQSAGRILASDARALRSHPPHPNSAVDGYALKGPLAEGPQLIPLTSGRSAAGQPFAAPLPDGTALRILTGAPMPKGADTVVLQEDVTAKANSIAINGPLKAGANARNAGEDMIEGQCILEKGRQITTGDIGMLTAAGLSEVTTYAPLHVGVLSTGDELRSPPEAAKSADIYDANRPMLLANIERWGMVSVDLGRAPDNRKTVSDTLTRATKSCDAILTSGGASAGDEDHISALLQDTGSFALWRVAVKPGRPMALGLWQGTPVFGLPGNPVAAQVCALIFARPALLQLAGAKWATPAGFNVPAGFTKSKKAGRREYLRARVENGKAIPFASEGSGRVSGLSWATGLIELPDHAVTINEGEAVRFIPFSSFGL